MDLPRLLSHLSVAAHLSKVYLLELMSRVAMDSSIQVLPGVEWGWVGVSLSYLSSVEVLCNMLSGCL